MNMMFLTRDDIIRHCYVLTGSSYSGLYFYNEQADEYERVIDGEVEDSISRQELERAA